MSKGDRVVARFEDLSPRARIREAALAMFDEHGVQGASLRVIAKAADVSLGALLHYYPTRDDLERSLHDEVRGEVVAALRSVNVEGDAAATIRERRRAYAEIMRDRPNVASFLRQSILRLGPLGTELFEHAVATERRELDQMVASGIARPMSDPDATAALYFILVQARVLFRPQLEAILGIDLSDPAAGRRLDLAEIDLLTRPLFVSN